MRFKFKDDVTGEFLTDDQAKQIHHYRDSITICRTDNDQLTMPGILYRHDFFHQHRWLEWKFTGHEMGFEWRSGENAKYFFIKQHEGQFVIIAMDDDFNYLFALFEIPLKMDQLTNNNSFKFEDLIQGKQVLEINHHHGENITATVDSVYYIFDHSEKMMNVVFYTTPDMFEENNIKELEYYDDQFDLKIIC